MSDAHPHECHVGPCGPSGGLYRAPVSERLAEELAGSDRPAGSSTDVPTAGLRRCSFPLGQPWFGFGVTGLRDDFEQVIRAFDDPMAGVTAA